MFTGAIGGVLMLLIIVTVVYCKCRSRRQNTSSSGVYVELPGSWNYFKNYSYFYVLSIWGQFPYCSTHSMLMNLCHICWRICAVNVKRDSNPKTYVKHNCGNAGVGGKISGTYFIITCTNLFSLNFAQVFFNIH